MNTDESADEGDVAPGGIPDKPSPKAADLESSNVAATGAATAGKSVSPEDSTPE